MFSVAIGISDQCALRWNKVVNAVSILCSANTNRTLLQRNDPTDLPLTWNLVSRNSITRKYLVVYKTWQKTEKVYLSLDFRISRSSSKSSNRTEKNIPMYKYSPNLRQKPIYRSEIPSFGNGLSVQRSKQEVMKSCYFRKNAEEKLNS